MCLVHLAKGEFEMLGDRLNLKFALVGCGRIADRHSAILGSGTVARATLAGVCDTVPARATGIAAKYGVPAFFDYDEMMRVANPDVVVVLTESGLHAKHVIDLSKFGKHIVVEKPMALTLRDADDMIEACDRAGIKLFVVKQNRFNVPIQKLREALIEGRFGKLVLGTVRVRWARHQNYYDQDSWRGTWALDGGVLSNQASHHIDMLEWMMGDVETVAALATTRLAKIEAEDTAVAVLRFTNGALGVIEATTAARPTDLEGSISLLGEGGTVEVGGFAMNEIRHWNFVEPKVDDVTVKTNFSVNPPNVYGFGHHAYYEHVVDSILNGGPNLIDGLEGRRSLELIVAIYNSVETGLPVSVRAHPQSSKLGSGR